MRGVSPIVSTILMVAIAIAAAVVVYYVVMNVVSTQGSQVEQQATQLSTGAIRIVGATLDINASDTNTNNIDTSKGENLTVYYTILNAEDSNLADYKPVDVYIMTQNGEVNCLVTDASLDFSKANTLSLKSTVSCSGQVKEGQTYKIKVTAKNLGPSNEYEVKAS